ncbi:hypothetical protein FACS189472_14500 [Alphaproteobacteria bacterium]|nr:hypothetical protein FACS189472_14500 [Alphaproteobacteria bacterium]
MIRLSIFSAIIVFLFADTRATESAVQLNKSESRKILLFAPTNVVGHRRRFSMSDVTVNDRNVSDLMQGINYIVDRAQAMSVQNENAIYLFKTVLAGLNRATVIGESRNVRDVIREVYLKSLQEHQELAPSLNSIYKMFDTAKVAIKDGEMAIEFEIFENEAEENPNVEAMVSSAGCCGFLCRIFGKKK